MQNVDLQLNSVDHLWLWLILFIAGVWFLYRTYLGIFRRSERRLTWVLMGLRGAGLLALVVALMQPSLTRRHSTTEPGRVAVVLDDTISMSLADDSGRPRFDRAREAVDRLRQTIDQSAAGRLRVDLFDAGGEALENGPPAEPRGERTDLMRVIAQTTARLRSQAVAGVVLVSDGADNTGRQDFLALGESPLPVYAVGFRENPEVTGLDLALDSVQAPGRVIVKNEVKVDAQLVKTAGPAISASLSIRRGGEELARQTVQLPAGDARQPVDLRFTPAEAGSFVFTAVISSEAGERLLANNSRHFPLQVDANPIRVFYIEGFLRNEYKFLKRRLEDDPDLSLVSVVRRANPERLPGTSGGDLINAERLKSFDIVILGDLEAGYLAEPEYRALVEWVNAGHALLVLGGYRSFAPDGWRVTPLADALPVIFREQEPTQHEEPFVLELTEAGRMHPAFEISGDRVNDATLWAGAPQLLGSSLVAQTKPGAEVLAVNPNLVVEGTPAPVVVVQRYGAGRVMVLAMNSTWRWSRMARVAGQSDTLFSRFWSQTARWLAGRDPEKNRPLIVVSTDRPDYEVGKPVVVRVARQPRADLDLSAAEVSAEVAGEAMKPTVLQMKSNSADPDVFSATFYPSAGGRFEITANLVANGQTLANQTCEFLVHGSDLELADPRARRDVLQSIATATGGVYVDVDEAATLAAKIQPRERHTVNVVRSELWDSPLLFMFFIGAVTAEWIIRKRNHLV